MSHVLTKIIITGSVLLLINVFVHAGTQPTFTITPTAPNANSIQASAVRSTSVIYQVTNRTSITRSLTTQPIPGITINPGPVGACTNPFTLSSDASCLLNLTIDGSQLPSTGVNRGPDVCKVMGAGDNNPTPFLCSQPSQANSLNIAMRTPVMYLGNVVTPALTKCFIDSTTGDIDGCEDSGAQDVNPVGMAINATGNTAYILNYTNPVTVTKCSIDSTTGNLSQCAATDMTGIPGDTKNVQNIVLNAANTKAYIPDPGNLAMYVCDINPINGDIITPCVDSGAALDPVDLVFNSAGTLAYVTGRIKDVNDKDIITIQKCVVNANDGLLSSCVDSGATLTGARGIAMNTAQTLVYTVAADDSIATCHLNSTTGKLSSCTASLVLEFKSPRGIVLNAAQTLSYVDNYDTGLVSKCSMSLETGAVTSCTNSAFSAGVGLHSLAIR